MKKKLLLTPIWRTESILVCIAKFQIDKLLILADEEIKDDQKKVIDELKRTFRNILDIEVVESSQYNVLKITKDSLNIINEHQKEYDIIINTSTGRRTQALGILYSMITVPQFISKIVYVTEDANEIIELPILSHGLSRFKVEILELLSKGHSIDEISKMLERSKSMIYGHIRFLKNRGFLEESGNLTVAGKIVVSKF